MRLRTLGLGIAAIVVLGVAAAGFLAWAQHAGSTLTLCGVTADVAETDGDALDLAPAFLERHPALGDAIARAGPNQPGYAPVDDCAEGEAVVEDLEAAGAPLAEDGLGRLVRHEGQVYRVVLSVGVA